MNGRIEQSGSDNSLVRAIGEAKRYERTTSVFNEIIKNIVEITPTHRRPVRDRISITSKDDDMDFQKKRPYTKRPKPCSSQNDEQLIAVNEELRVKKAKIKLEAKDDKKCKAKLKPETKVTSTKKLVSNSKEEKKPAKKIVNHPSASLSSSSNRDVKPSASSSSNAKEHRVPPAYSLFIEMWSANLLEKAIHIMNKFNSDPCKVYMREFSPSIWSSDCYIEDNVDPPASPADLAPKAFEGCHYDNIFYLSTLDTFLFCFVFVENDEDSGDLLSPESPEFEKLMRRSSRVPKFNINDILAELSSSDLSNHSLITPIAYGMLEDKLVQPYRIKVHPQVPFLCDLHSHLCVAEVIGLLAGRWDQAERVMYIQASFPCAATQRADDGSVDVELDPVAEYEVREVISGLGMCVVGWYHSHPRFKPEPSVTDIFNQNQYQQLMHDEQTDLAPFVGLIVSTFDPKLPSCESYHQVDCLTASTPTLLP